MGMGDHHLFHPYTCRIFMARILPAGEFFIRTLTDLCGSFPKVRRGRFAFISEMGVPKKFIVINLIG
jgi:hypothetical protein